ncbi:MAG TPA: TonB-dependent receptor, partial [Terriglobales bacterium]|nr:TonB-dependent receptor [Terriglobales bacterium]
MTTLVLVSAANVLGQTPDGALAGAIRDASGARVVSAQVSATATASGLSKSTISDASGEFRLEALQPGEYRLEVTAPRFATTRSAVTITVGSVSSVAIVLKPEAAPQTVQVEAGAESVTSQNIETTSSIEQTAIAAKDLVSLPLASRSFANIAYLSPMTQPVEPSDPTKARITAVSFGGSSGLNVDLSVDGGDNNDDFIGGFLQSYSPDAIQEFVVRTAQYDADTSRTNGGSIIISTRRGANNWHSDLAAYFREQALNARNRLDNPEPNPKQPFSRENLAGTLGGPLIKSKLWMFSSVEYVHENASVAYSNDTLAEFRALAQLAAQGEIPGVASITVPSSVEVPFKDFLYDHRLDWVQSARSQWFLRGAVDWNRTKNDLIQQATLPSAGAQTDSDYWSVLLNNQYQFSPSWLGSFTFQANSFHHTKKRNSHLGFGLAFPFSANFHTTSGFETFGDNQFATPITAFPIRRDQHKYQFRYDVTHSAGTHTVKFGINFIHEPVFGGELASDAETLIHFGQDPSFYVSNGISIAPAFDPACAADPAVCPPDASAAFSPGGNGHFSQSLQRLGLYAQDSWRLTPSFTVNYGLRYDTSFGLFDSNGASQSQNPALPLLKIPGAPAPFGVPHDYRKAFAPRLGIAYAPDISGNTVIRAGVGLYYNDLGQNGWVDAFRAVNAPLGEHAALIDPRYHTPYALQASAGVEHTFNRNWAANVFYEHQQGVHQYRRYEYVAGVTLPAAIDNNISLFKSDNRSRYDGVSFVVQHNSRWLNLTAHYTLANATTWGATVGELFDYVNGVSDVRNPFGPGDHGPSGEDVRHRFVIAGTVHLPWKFELSTLSQFESARPFTMADGADDLNGDGIMGNDRVVVNGVQTRLDQFRGTPFAQVDMRVSREFKIGERGTFVPFAEFFNLLNRQNPGNNYVGD